MLGIEGAGKTLLCRHLELLCSGGDADTLQRSTVTTVGVELLDLEHLSGPPRRRRGAERKRFTMREAGGSMQPLWHRFLHEQKPVIFVVDHR